MLERHVQVLKYQGRVNCFWLAEVIHLFKQFEVNIRKIELLPVFESNGDWGDELKVLIEFEKKVFKSNGSQELEFENLLQAYLKGLSPWG